MVVIYKVKIAPALYANWVTEITQMEAPHYFVDEQRFGPYKFWHHLHRFAPTEGGVLAEDVIHYGLYGGPLASVIDAAVVQRQLKAIFAFRKRVLAELFGA
jgi:ligand-binding SRPBCC domain-containing protein